jgi:hypothetical protein
MTNKLGQTIYLSGLNHYIRSNSCILQAGGSVVDAGPTELSLAGQDPAFAAAISVAAGNISVAFDDTLDWLDEDGGHMLVSMGSPVGGSRNYVQGPWKVAGAIDGDSVTPPTTPDTSLSPPFTPVAGQKCDVRARIIRADGRVSGFFGDTVTIVA